MKHMEAHLKAFNKERGADVSMKLIERSLVALQGPLAHQVLSKLLPASVDLSEVMNYRAIPLSLSLSSPDPPSPPP